MSVDVRVRPQARADLMEIAEYLAESDMDAADRFLSAAQSGFHRLGQMPGIGRLRNFPNPALRNVRSWAVPGFLRYLVFYISDMENVDIMRVLHGSRDLETALEDTPPS